MSVRPFSSFSVCAEPFWPFPWGHGVFPCFMSVGVSRVVDVGCWGLASVCSNITFIVDGVV
jgi:hypothetical protein